MPPNAEQKQHGLHLGRKQYGRPRSRRPVRRVTLELDEEVLADVIEVAAGASPLRAIVEAGLQMWLAQQRQQVPREQSDAPPILEQFARQVPQTPSDYPKGRQASEE